MTFEAVEKPNLQPLPQVAGEVAAFQAEGLRSSGMDASVLPSLDALIAEMPASARPGPSVAAMLQRLGDLRLPERRKELQRTISGLIARIDSLLAEQVDAIIHHPRFQRLEAAYRGLRFLVDHACANRMRPLSMATSHGSRSGFYRLPNTSCCAISRARSNSINQGFFARYTTKSLACRAASLTAFC